MQVVVVRDWSDGRGRIGAVALNIPADLIKRYGGKSVVPVSVTAPPEGLDTPAVVRLTGLTQSPLIQVSAGDILEMEEI